MAWRDERGRYIFRYQDQEYGIGRLSALTVGMVAIALLSIADEFFDIGIFTLPFWAFALTILLPVMAIAYFGGARLERAFGVDDVRAATRPAKIGFILSALAVCTISLLAMLVAFN